MLQRALLGDVHFAKPQHLCGRAYRALFAMQNRVEIGAIKTVALREKPLTSRPLDCGFQQTNDVFVIKYMRVPSRLVSTMLGVRLLAWV